MAVGNKSAGCVWTAFYMLKGCEITEQSVASVGGKMPFDPNLITFCYWIFSCQSRYYINSRLCTWQSQDNEVNLYSTLTVVIMQQILQLSHL